MHNKEIVSFIFFHFSNPTSAFSFPFHTQPINTELLNIKPVDSIIIQILGQLANGSRTYWLF